MSKLAICFLVTKNIVNLDVWEAWWKGYEAYINIYAHFSQIGDITQEILLNNRVNPVPTKWGDISLVKAEGELYKKVVDNPENGFSVLVSDTCIPVREFSKTYSRIFRNRNRGFLEYRTIDNMKADPSPFITDGDCAKFLKKYGFYNRRVYASDQWKILSRKNMQDFLKMLENRAYIDFFTKCIEIVPDSLAPDELMYVNWMYAKTKGNLLSRFRKGGLTYVDFKGKAIHPINFRQITKNLSEEICQTNTMFIRKFPVPIVGRLLRQTPVKCHRSRSVSRGKLPGTVKPRKSRRKSRK